MICEECVDHVRSTIEYAGMNNPKLPMQNRRNAAIRVLSMSRSRLKRLPLRFLA